MDFRLLGHLNNALGPPFRVSLFTYNKEYYVQPITSFEKPKAQTIQLCTYINICTFYVYIHVYICIYKYICLRMYLYMVQVILIEEAWIFFFNI